MYDWDWENYDYHNLRINEEAPAYKTSCEHEWKGTWLIITQVWDCTKCGKHKEECE